MRADLDKLRPSKPPTPKINFRRETSSWEGITVGDLARWKDAFPAVDIETQLKRAGLWLVDHPAQRKTNLRAYLTRWFAKEQDRPAWRGPTPLVDKIDKWARGEG